MSVVVDFPFSLQDIDQVFDMTELLSNTEDLIEKFKPEVSKYLIKDGFFRGHAKQMYQAAFNDLIVSLIRKELVAHFPAWTPEDIMLLTDMDFIKMIAEPLFEQKNYKNLN